MGSYITKDGEQAIINFKYKGGNVAYSYAYIWSPIAEFILKYMIPLNWAPNLITLIGVLIQISGCVYVAIHTPLSSNLPSGALAVYGICLFTYQMLDNVDGKQARRTGTSSPLGMLFDHGCDAFGVMFMSFAFGRMITVDDEKTFILGCFIGIIFGFYLSVWTQYHSKGVLVLGRINAVDDGIPVAWILAIFTEFVGQDFWRNTSLLGMPITYFMPRFVAFMIIVQLVSLIKNTKGNFTKNYLYAFSHFLHAALVIASLLSVLQLTDWYLEEKYFYQIFFSVCICFIRDITYMQVCVVAEQKYNQWSLSTCAYILSYPLYIALERFVGIRICDEGLFVNAVLVFIVLEYAQFVVSVTMHIARILNINVFSIKKQQLDKLKAK